jgi:N-sulfoglucosamine sulfohydrolase
MKPCCFSDQTLLSRLLMLGLAAVLGLIPATLSAQKKKSSSSADTKPDPRPNLILILADDLGFEDCGPFGNDRVQSPNLARLAKEGMRFDRAFVTASSCSPCRASIITGRYPHQTGAEELHWPVPENQVTFVEELKKAGYWTGAAGKWHLGEPLKKRFDVVMEADESGFQLPAGQKSASKGKFDEKAAGDAQSGCADWLPLLQKRAKGKPFFLWLASLDPHRDFSEKAVDPPTDPKTVNLAPYHPDTPEVRADYARYYDEIARLDSHIGAVLDELDKLELAENTLIVFLSDNGRPFPRDKTTLYDSGIRTPMIARWPGRARTGAVCREIVSTVDIAPAFLDAAGIEKDKRSATFAGRSFLPLLEKPETPLREFVFAEKNWHDFEDHARAVRTPRYKYIRNGYPDLPLTPPADAWRSPTGAALREWRDWGRLLPHQKMIFEKPRPTEELYDTVDDPHELRNLATDGRHKIVLETLRTALDDWIRETGDVRTAPDLRTADEFDRETALPTAARTRPRWDKARMVEAGLTAPGPEAAKN